MNSDVEPLVLNPAAVSIPSLISPYDIEGKSEFELVGIDDAEGNGHGGRNVGILSGVIGEV